MESGQFPTGAIFTTEKALRSWVVREAEVFGIPFESFSGAISDVPEMVGFGERAGVAKRAGGGGTGFAGVQPFLMMSDGRGDGRFRPLEAGEFVFWQQEVFVIISEQHALIADEDHTAIPARDFFIAKQGRLLGALVPSECDRPAFSSRGIRIAGPHRGRGNFGMRRRPAGLDGEGSIQIQRPKGKVIPVTPQIGHGAIAEIPPPVPLGTGKINVVIRPHRRRPDPEIPVEMSRNRHLA